MKKIGIITCYNESKQYPGINCFNAFNNRTASFKDYDSESVVLGFVHCNGCSKDSAELVLQRAKKMKETGVDVIHLSTCMKKMCPRYKEHLNALSNDFEVAEYTHD